MNHKKKRQQLPSWYTKFINLGNNKTSVNDDDMQNEESSESTVNEPSENKWDIFEYRFNIFLGSIFEWKYHRLICNQCFLLYLNTFKNGKYKKSSKASFEGLVMIISQMIYLINIYLKPNDEWVKYVALFQ